jgi:hypothetical protein
MGPFQHFTAQKFRRRLSHPGWMLLDASTGALPVATPARALDARRAAICPFFRPHAPRPGVFMAEEC